jgi:hypothetical protein
LLFQYARSTTNAWDATNGIQISSTASSTSAGYDDTRELIAAQEQVINDRMSAEIERILCERDSQDAKRY